MSARRRRRGKGRPTQPRNARRKSAQEQAGAAQHAEFYDPAEAFAALEHREDEGSRGAALFDIDDLTGEGGALAEAGDALEESDSAVATEGSSDGSTVGPHEHPSRPETRKRRGLIAGWLFRGASRSRARHGHERGSGDDEGVSGQGSEPPVLGDPLFEVAAFAGAEAYPVLVPGTVAETPPPDDEAPGFASGAKDASDGVADLEPDREAGPSDEMEPASGLEPVEERSEPEPATETDKHAEAPTAGDLAEAAASDPDIEPQLEDETSGDTDASGEPEHRARPVRRRRSSRAHRTRPKRAELAEPAAAPAIESEPTRPPGRVRAVLANGTRTAGAVALIMVLLMAGLYGLVVGVNAFARWNARRMAAQAALSAAASVDNLLIIGVRDGVAVGFTALKAERANDRVLGIAIPEGAFVEVPGQGFERIGASFVAGPDVSKDTVTNYLGVPFKRYVVIDADSYQSLLTNQNVAGVMAKATQTDLTAAQRSSFTAYFASVKTKDVWIVPLPVKPVAVGDQRYYEPERAQVADLLLQWWGVKVSEQKATPRVIVYNGVGTPGLAGLAAQQLIRTGFRVVDSGNAPKFGYKTTQILLYHGTRADAEALRKALGVGQIQIESAPQDLTDMIVIIGADYRPPVDDASTVPTASTSPTEGTQ